MVIVGYARVSTLEQSLDLQLDALEKAGCERVYKDHISGTVTARPGLDECLRSLREGDTLVVWRMDRLGRSLRHLIDSIATLQQQGIQFKSLTEEIATTTAMGTLVFHIFGALAEFERNLLRERTLAGMEAARARGRKGGKPKKLTSRQVSQMKVLYNSKQVAVKDICQQFKIGKTAFYRYVRGGSNALGV